MSLTNSQYNVLRRMYENNQLNNRQLDDECLAKVTATIPEFTEIQKSISSISVQHAKKMLFGEADSMDALKVQLAALRKQKAQLLQDYGFPADYLEPHYTCPDCKDTGYIENKKCHCFKQAEIELLYDQSGIRRQLDEQNFSVLSYNYYKNEDLTRFQGAVSTSKAFINNFDHTYTNLFFCGTVGTGKSFLSGCIAKELIDTGHSVLYFSSSDLFDVLAKPMYHQEDDESLEDKDVFSCDLLIIDDLGTEMTNNFVMSSLFKCLTVRDLHEKATIISTNLSLEDIQQRYTERVLSRIIDKYEICRFSGPDIRIIKKTSRQTKMRAE